MQLPPVVQIKSVSDSFYNATIQERINDFLKRNPGVKKEEIPSDIITASGSGVGTTHLSSSCDYTN